MKYGIGFRLRRLSAFLAVIGFLSVFGGGVYVIHKYGVPSPWLIKDKFIKLAHHVTRRVGIETLIVPENGYANQAFVGHIKKGHPRVLFATEDTYTELRNRYKTDARYQKLVDAQAKGKGYRNAIVAWVCRGDRKTGRYAIGELLRLNLKEPTDSGKYYEAMNLALAYDFLGNLPDWDEATRSRVELKLAEYVRSGLQVLNGRSASMWHARTSLASAVWVAAMVLDGPLPDLAELRRNAQAHFVAILKATALSEGWPEGYNYWINNRAFLLGVACAAHINGVEAPEINAMIHRIIERVGLWTIYGTEPIGRFHLFGDTGPRNDLKDETQRVMDLFTLIMGYPTFRDYSRYLTGLHRKGGYHGPYRWALPLLRSASEWDFAPSDALPDLSVYDGWLPTSDIFGRDALGQVFIRSDWGPDATFISFQAGHSLAHHGHYQAGHFTITKKAPLAITSGTYGKYFDEHRLNYYIRTVAANSILVLKPDEKVRPNRFFVENVADGGQRIVIPTGSAVLSVENWEANLYKGRCYEGGHITAFENSEPRFVYVGSDLTGAYNSTRYDENGGDGKVSEVSRQMVYLRDDDLLLVYDRVVSTDASYTKKWLLHSWGRPETDHETVLVGTRDNGILETSDAYARIRNKDGVLEVLRLLPKDAVMRKVGGQDYRYYVEVDGDDSNLNGRNMVSGAKEEFWFDSGMWRLEIQPSHGRLEDRFLIVLVPRVAGANQSTQIAKLPAQGAVAVETPSAVILFRDHNAKRVHYEIPAGEKRLHILAGVPEGKEVRVEIGGAVSAHRTTGNGTVAFEIGKGSSRTVVVDVLD